MERMHFCWQTFIFVKTRKVQSPLRWCANAAPDANGTAESLSKRLNAMSPEQANSEGGSVFRPPLDGDKL